MKIGTKYITIHRNINQIENDFQLLTENKKPEDITKQIKIFYGEINNRHFKFKDKKLEYGRSIFIPELRGELIEKNIDTTLIKIDIHIIVKYFSLICNILLILFIIYLLIKTLLECSENVIKQIIILLSVLFGIPIMHCCINLYSINKIIKNINYYEEGYLDIYIN